jgi:hypothetical protein
MGIDAQHAVYEELACGHGVSPRGAFFVDFSEKEVIVGAVM